MANENPYTRYVMPDGGTLIRTEVRGLDLYLLGNLLCVLHSGEDLIPPMQLSPEAADRVALEMAKSQLPEWNQIESLKTAAAKRYRGYLGSWLVLCLAAFSAYVGYPSYYLCILLCLLAVYLWWHTGFLEQKAERAAQAERSAFVNDWSYLQGRLEESERDGEAAPCNQSET